jgi:hypothetical protein
MLTGKRRKALLEEAKRQMYSNGSLKHQVDERPVDDLQQLYLDLNDELFNSDLPEDLPVIYSFNLNNRRTKSTCYGKCYYSSQGISKRGHRKKCKAVKIEIKPGMTPSQTRKTLVHEMCHAFCFNRFGEVGHGRQFWLKMRKCGYPKGHSLPNQRDFWSR